MELIKTRAAYTYSDVYLTTVDGITYRVAPARPDNVETLSLCEYTPGTGWKVARPLTEEERAEFIAFKAANK